jgi:hypothetical protein
MAFHRALPGWSVRFGGPTYLSRHISWAMMGRMANDHAKLRAALQQLKTQLASATSLEREHADQLHQAVADVEALLDDKTESPADEPVTDRLADAARELEAEHPTIAGTVFSMIEALAQMGI